MPQPSVKDGEEQYAGVEGQVVWEGEVLDKYTLFRGEEGWVAVWKGEVHVGESEFIGRGMIDTDRPAYVRTNIQDPVLGLTASLTLRDAPVRAGHKRGTFSIDTISTRAGADDFDEDAREYGGDGLAGMEQIDLLGGLAGGELVMYDLASYLTDRIDWATRDEARAKYETGPLYPRYRRTQRSTLCVYSHRSAFVHIHCSWSNTVGLPGKLPSRSISLFCYSSKVLQAGPGTISRTSSPYANSLLASTTTSQRYR
jgi:hypothetical protein